MGLPWKQQEILILVIMTACLAESLTGDNVCNRQENYTETMNEQYQQTVRVFTVTWCFRLPPRCSQYHDELRTRFRIKTEVKQRNVNECCKGYIKQELPDGDGFIDKCVPLSNCTAGYIGHNCNTECPAGSWGIGCMQTCDCKLHQTCNPVDGACQCSPGWQGPGCSDKCNPGSWGLNCSSKCSCNSKSSVCHHETGQCMQSINSLMIKSLDSSSSVNLLGSTTTQVRFNSDDGIINNDFPESPSSSSKLEVGGSKVTLDSMRETTAIYGVINEYYEDTSIKPDVFVGVKVDKSTPRPLVAVVRVSGKSATGHEMIVTPISSAEKVPVNAPLPLDIVALIGIGSIISLGVTTLAILAILHVRSKLYESIRLSTIYNLEKPDTALPRGKGSDNGRILSISRNSEILTPSCGYETPRCIIPPERDGTLPRPSSTVTQESTYSNQYPNIQLFSSIRELLEAQYDKPPKTIFRQSPVELEGEHLYDEIPLQSTKKNETLK